MVETEQVQNRGMQIVQVRPVFHRFEPQFIGRSITQPAPHASPREPHAEAVGVVIPPRLPLPLAERHPPELPAPDHEGAFEQAALLEVGQQRGDRLIHLARMLPVVGLDALVRIPGLFEMPAPRVQLHKPHSPLHQPAGDQAVPPKLVGRSLPHAVRLLRRLGLLRQVDRLGSLGLHPKRQFVAVDPRRQLVPSRTLVEVPMIQLGQQVQLPTLRHAVEMLGPLQVKHRVSHRPKQRPLVGSRHEPARPVGLPTDRSPALVEDDHIPREVLVLGPQSVDRPTPQRGTPNERLASVHRHQGRAMRVAVGVARVDDRQLVGVLADPRKEVGNHQPALTPGSERTEAGGQEAHLAAPRVDELFVGRQRLPGEFLQHRLVVERVDLARCAVHHQEDDRADRAGKLPRPTRQGPPHRPRGTARPTCRRVCHPGQKLLFGQQRRQGGPGQTAPHFPDKLAAGGSAGKQRGPAPLVGRQMRSRHGSLARKVELRCGPPERQTTGPPRWSPARWGWHPAPATQGCGWTARGFE